MTSSPPSHFAALGGEAALRAIIQRFVERVMDDAMIGFFFRKVDPERLKRFEYEFAAAHLGADVKYAGRSLAEAHRGHRIMGGQFLRRLKILEEVLVEFNVPEEVRRHWLEHTESQRHHITQEKGGECIAAGPVKFGGRRG